MHTLAAHLAFLTSGNNNIALPAGTEVGVFSTIAYPPGHPNYNASVSIRPVVPPIDYTSYECLFFMAPLTVQNAGTSTALLTVNIYSDNVYVYQQRATIPPNSLYPLYFGAQALGYIGNQKGNAGMPIDVTLRADEASLTCLTDTNGPAGYRSGATPARVAGASVVWVPMD